MKQLFNAKHYLQLALCLFLIHSITISAANDSRWRFTTSTEVISVSDIHGDFDAFVSIMQKAKLLDADNNWIAGRKHFVSTGDYLDRGPDSRKVMDLFIKLEKQATAAGGKFHVLLGNHEVMNLIGDRRYVARAEYAAFQRDESAAERSKFYNKYLSIYKKVDSEESLAQFTKIHPAGYFGLHAEFKHDGYYGNWLLSKPFLIVINNKVFTHGGLSKTVGELGLNGINESLNKEMNQYAKLWYKFIEDGLFLHSFNLQDRKDIANALIEGKINKAKFQSNYYIKKVEKFLRLAEGTLTKSESPIWYRGTALCHQYSEEILLDKVLSQLGATSAFLGHTITNSNEVESRFNGKVTLQDTGMLSKAYGGQASLVFHNGNHTQVFDARHGLHDIEEQPPRIWHSPYGMTIKQLENFLLTADVIASKEIGLGISKPLKLTLQKGNRTLYAMYKNIDTYPNMELRHRWPKQGNKADRYKNELAAYELNKLLDLNIIPPTVQRTYRGKSGIFQFWINNGVNRTTMIEEKMAYGGYCSKKSQTDLMKIFDALIYNDDRNTGNILFQKDEWQLWLIDHTRAFLVSTKLPKTLKWSKLRLSKSFKQRLAALNHSELKKVLSKYLHTKQIYSLLKRRDSLVSRL